MSASPSKVRFSFSEAPEPSPKQQGQRPFFTPHPRLTNPFDERDANSECETEAPRSPRQSSEHSSHANDSNWLGASQSRSASPMQMPDPAASGAITEEPLFKLNLPITARRASSSAASQKSSIDLAKVPNMPVPHGAAAPIQAKPILPLSMGERRSHLYSQDHYTGAPRPLPLVYQSPANSAHAIFASPHFPPTKHQSDDTLVDVYGTRGHDLEMASPDPARSHIRSGQVSPLKPALRRSTTEEDARREPARQAVDLVERMRHSERGEESGGVLSQLLRLQGMNNSIRLTEGNLASHDPGRMNGDDMSRVSSMESTVYDGASVRRRRGRAGSDCSLATTINPFELDAHDPRLSKDYKGSRYTTRRKKSWGRRRSSSWTEKKVADKLAGKGDDGKEEDDESISKRKKNRLKIATSVASIIQRQTFILKLAKTLMTFGAPSHRLEAQLCATAHSLSINAQFLHLPSILIATFGDQDTRTSETTFIKASGDLNLGKLHKTHEIYRAVLHEELEIAEATAALVKLLKSPPIYPVWTRIILAATCAGIIGPLGFGGSILDGVASFFFGASLAWLQARVAAKSAAYANIFEISCTCIIAFVARGLDQTGLFCYQSLVSAAVVSFLPGYIILSGSLDLASRHMISGAVKLVFAIIYALFLGFGVAVGSDIFLLIDPAARGQVVEQASEAGISVSGFFSTNDTSSPFAGLNGTFTFQNGTAEAAADLVAAAAAFCHRSPNLGWWRTTLPWWTQFFLVPVFATLLSLSNMAPIRSREFPVMIIIGCIGWAANALGNKFIFERSDVVSFIGAMVIGILGNVYSRVFRGTAFTAMATGVLFLVPAGISAAGGIGTTSMTSSGDSYSNGLIIGFRMVQVSIGITIGLFFSSFIVYSFGNSHKGNAIFAF